MIITENDVITKCAHCNDDCPDHSICIEDNYFCCSGCKTVYQILTDNRLTNYYTLNSNAGISPKEIRPRGFDYLDDPQVIQKIIDFQDDRITAVTFYVPSMHCSSCIWLLEHLFKINPLITGSQVNFLKKKVSIKFLHNEISLKEVVLLLASLGYEPLINLDSIDGKTEEKGNKLLYYKLGVAAFCFGNIMLLSFPEYLSIDVADEFYRKLFSYLNIILALPVFLYSSSQYYVSAYKGLKNKIVNIDVPISLGIFVLFFRSLYEVLSSTGAGYFDSLAGLLFFMLLGKLFQSKTYDSLNFERNYKSYFPLSVTLKNEGEERSVPVSNLRSGDRIVIRNQEIIPADSVLISGEASIDYSFVTGESKPVQKISGEIIYAGGRQKGGIIELETIKDVSQSYLTRLWNNEAFNKEAESSFTHFSHTVSKYFTIIIILIAVIAAYLWLPDVYTAMNVFTAVLIIACPCALALSVPFTLGNSLRILGRNKFYPKNTRAVEELAKAGELVFDKTGTITYPGGADVSFSGSGLTEYQKLLVSSAVRGSTHPLSRIIYEALKTESQLQTNGYSEIAGEGISVYVDGNSVKLGSRIHAAPFTVSGNSGNSHPLESHVHLSVNGSYLGYFSISNCYREGVKPLMEELKNNQGYSLSLLSGDNEAERGNLTKIFENEEKIKFSQSPQQKLEYIKNLQQSGKKVIMIGDGLNDAGALSQADAGIAVTEDVNSFAPACDVIMDAANLKNLNKYLKYAKISVYIIYISFGISFLYNIAGLSFAVQGLLTPIIAAILMPLSSISVVAFATLSTNYMAKRMGL